LDLLGVFLRKRGWIMRSKKAAFEMSFLVKIILGLLLLFAAIGLWAILNTKSSGILGGILNLF
jgi:hypothetical protein